MKPSEQIAKNANQMSKKYNKVLPLSNCYIQAILDYLDEQAEEKV